MLLCRFHHRAVHEQGYRVEPLPDGGLRFRWPHGRILAEVPALPPVPDDPVGALRAGHAALGLRIHSRTAYPTGAAERVDVGYVIDVTHPLAGDDTIGPSADPAGETSADRALHRR